MTADNLLGENLQQSESVAEEEYQKVLRDCDTGDRWIPCKDTSSADEAEGERTWTSAVRTARILMKNICSAGDTDAIWTWLQDTEVRVLRYWVYKRVFTPLEQEKKYVDQSEYEDSYCKKGIIRECVQLPDGDLLLGFQNYIEGCDFYDLPQYMEYYKLSEIRLAYNPEDMARDEDDQQ